MTPEFRVAGSNRVQIGCDVHSVRHVSQSIEAFGSRYLDRVFTARERRESEDSPERLAARFAGKEAVLKALRVPPTVPVPWTTIEVHADAIGAPVVTLTGPVEDFAREQRLGFVEVTLSHDTGVALAFAVARTSQDLEMSAA